MFVAPWFVRPSPTAARQIGRSSNGLINNSAFLLGLESQGSLGAGFDSAMLEVSVDNFLSYERSFTSLADAQRFFTDDTINLGFQPGGLEDVKLVFDLTSSQPSSGFQFDYAFAGSAAVPGPTIGAGQRQH
jgi:hypothetical protein